VLSRLDVIVRPQLNKDFVEHPPPFFALCVRPSVSLFVSVSF